MLFNSFEYVFFFLPIVFFGFNLLILANIQVTTLWLLTASLFFYSWWYPPFLVILMSSIILNFLFGKILYRTGSKLILFFCASLNLSLLIYYKYFEFLFSGLGVTIWSLEHGEIAIPLAISFFTFQQITFLVDSYRRQRSAHSFQDYALFVSFFPQLIAGPIVHHSEMLSQLRRIRQTKWIDLGVGITFIVVGLFKKVVFGDTFASFADPIFASAASGAEISFIEAWLGVLSFTFQIYFDFSGYSDIATGSARIFGIRLPLNFFSPYKADSIIEFWRRWHITLSRFLREYVYFPLGGNRKGMSKGLCNIIIVMLIGGLWHGASMNFVIWGGIHGLYIVINHIWYLISSWSYRVLGYSLSLGFQISWFLTFISVVVAWVFFRAEGLSAAENILRGMVGNSGFFVFPYQLESTLRPIASFLQLDGIDFKAWIGFSYIGKQQLLILVCAALLVFIAPNTHQLLGRFHPALQHSVYKPQESSFRMRWTPSLLSAIIVLIMFLVAVYYMRQETTFLYFQF